MRPHLRAGMRALLVGQGAGPADAWRHIAPENAPGPVKGLNINAPLNPDLAQ